MRPPRSPTHGFACSGDARRLDDVRAALDAAAGAHGPVDVVVDVIGEARYGHTVDLDDAAWDDSFDLVLRHFFNLARARRRRTWPHAARARSSRSRR